jgi:hypothetical protein
MVSLHKVPKKELKENGTDPTTLFLELRTEKSFLQTLSNTELAK